MLIVPAKTFHLVAAEFTCFLVVYRGIKSDDTTILTWNAA